MQPRPETSSSVNTQLTFISTNMTTLLEDQNQFAINQSPNSARRHHKPQGISLLNRGSDFKLQNSPRTNVLSPVNTEYFDRQPLQTQVFRLRRQNNNLQNQMAIIQRQYAQKLNRQVAQIQRHMRNAYQAKINQLQTELNKKNEQTQAVSSQHIRTYQKYIDNLEKSKENLENQVRKLKKQNEKIQLLQSSLKHLERDNTRLEETIIQKDNEMNTTIAQITMETERKKGPVYIEQLQKTNLFLQKEVKRLNTILMERMKVARNMN